MSRPAARRLAAAPIQKAMYARASTDEVLAAMVKGVYDHVPENAEFDYVVVGEAIEQPDDAHDSFGSDTTVGLHVWTRRRGFLRGNEIAARLVELFDHQPLDVEGHRVIAVRHRQNQPVRDPDPEIRHVIVRMRVVTEQTA